MKAVRARTSITKNMTRKDRGERQSVNSKSKWKKIQEKKNCFWDQWVQSELFYESSAVCVELVRKRRWLRDGQTEGGRKAERQEHENSSLPQQKPIRVVKKRRGPTWGSILLEERAVSLLFLTPVSLWLSNQSLAEPMPVPLVYILIILVGSGQSPSDVF